MAETCHHHNCLEELSSDYKKILEKLDELQKALNPLIDKDKIKEFLCFTETFAEPHHQKEEKVLFPALEEKGIPNEGGPIGMMLYEHETKRGYVKALKEAFEASDENRIRENAQAIVNLLRDHIYKEDNILYPCAKDVLTEDELMGLSHQCEEI